MKSFIIGTLKKWSRIEPAAIVQFTGVKTRRVNIKLNTNVHVDVYAATNEKMEDAVLVASAKGLFEVEWRTTGTTYMGVIQRAEYDQDGVILEDAAAIFMSNHANALEMQKREELEVLTGIEPKRKKLTDFEQQMMIVNHNQMRRDEQRERDFQKKMQALEDARSAAVVEDDAKAKAKAEKEAEAKAKAEAKKAEEKAKTKAEAEAQASDDD